MKIHCPECQTAFDRDVLRGDERILCPDCEVSFVVNTKETVLYAGTDSEAEATPERTARGSTPLATGERLGGFVIDRMLGEGGMGVVFLGTQLSLDKKVAIKVLPPHLSANPDFIRRFNREAKALAALNHPNIVHIIDKGYADGYYYFVMEYVEGITLRQLMKERTLTAEEAYRIVPSVCSALEYAHARGIVHRDIKPENILITTDGRVKIADFGLSKIVEGDEPLSRITRTHTTVGTFEYMAPEQRESSRNVDPRADLYSLGVVFYEMLTGELPIGRFPPPSEKNGKISPAVDDLVLRVLDKDPDRRFQRASEVASEIVRASQPSISILEPILEDEPSLLDQVKAFARRHRGLLLVTFLIVCFARDALGPWAVVVAIVLFVRATRKPGPEGAPAAPPEPPILQAAPEPRPPATSLSCWLALLFGLTLLIGWTVLGRTYRPDLVLAFGRLPLDQMAGSLVGVALVGILGIVGILFGLGASGRARRRGKKGRWLARAATLASLIFVIQMSSFWANLQSEYRYWHDLESRIEQGEGVEDLYADIRYNSHDRRLERWVRVLVRCEPAFARRRLLLADDAEVSAAVKAFVLAELARSGDPAYLADIEKTLLPPAEARVRVAAVESLRHYPDPDVLDVLARYQESVEAYRAPGSRYSVRAEVLAAIEILAAIDEDRALFLLARWAADSDRGVAAVAGQAILVHPGSGPALVVATRRVLEASPMTDLRQRAARRLADLPDGAGVDPLIDGLSDRDEDVRRTCYLALESHFDEGYGYDPIRPPSAPANAEAIGKFRELSTAVRGD